MYMENVQKKSFQFKKSIFCQWKRNPGGIQTKKIKLITVLKPLLKFLKLSVSQVSMAKKDLMRMFSKKTSREKTDHKK